MEKVMDLFDYMREKTQEQESPLASRMRPQTLEEVVGQQHIIGKDITYFHTFFWLNLLRLLDIPLPKKLHVHGWITQENGEKYSKSQGDKLDLSVFSPEQIDSIRFYFASIYDKSVQDNLFSIQKAYEILSKSVTTKVLKVIQDTIEATRIKMDFEEAKILWPKIVEFKKLHDKEPSLNANDPLERRMAECIIYLKEEKRKRLANG